MVINYTARGTKCSEAKAKWAKCGMLPRKRCSPGGGSMLGSDARAHWGLVLITHPDRFIAGSGHRARSWRHGPLQHIPVGRYFTARMVAATARLALSRACFARAQLLRRRDDGGWYRLGDQVPNSPCRRDRGVGSLVYSWVGKACSWAIPGWPRFTRVTGPAASRSQNPNSGSRRQTQNRLREAKRESQAHPGGGPTQP